MRHIYKFFLLLILISVAITASANRGSNYLNQGNEAYLKGDLTDAMKLYSKAGQICLNEIDKIENNKALVFAQRGKYDLALERLTEAIEYNPNNENAYYNRAIVHTIKKEYSDAISDFEKAQFLGVNSDQGADYNIAIAYYLVGDIDKSKSFLQSAGTNTSDARVSYLRGLIAYRDQDYDGAAQAFADAALIKDDAHIQYAKGLSEYYRGNQQLGLSILEELKSNKEFESNYNILMANLAYEANDMETAKAGYENAIKKKSNNTESWAGLGNIAMSKENFDLATSHYKKAIKYNSKNMIALNGIARIEFLDKKYKAAVSTYDKVINISPKNHKALYGKALAAMHIPDPYTCLDALAIISKKNLSPAEVEKVVILEARALGICNKKEEAVSLLKKYRRLAQDKYQIKTLLAYYYLRMFQYGNAISSVSISKFKDYLPYLLAGHASLHRGEHSSAYHYYRKAYKIKPKNPDVLMGAALSMMAINMEKEAKRVIDSLEVLYPDNYYVFNSKGIIYKDLGLGYQKKNQKTQADAHFEIAAQAFRKATDIRPSLKTSFDNNLALTYYYRNDFITANKLFTKSRRLASINNQALMDISQGNYEKGIATLDSLNKDFIRKKNAPNSRVKNNLKLARKRAPLNNNYKFITYYFLHQDIPDISTDNPFKTTKSNIDLPIDLKPDTNFILEYSDVACEESDRERKKKKNSNPKFKILKKKDKNKCPTFKT